MQSYLFRQFTWIVLILFFCSLLPDFSFATSSSSPSKLPAALVLEVYSSSLSSSQVRSLSNAFRLELIHTGKFSVFSSSEIQKKLSRNEDETSSIIEIDRYISQAKKLYDEFKFESSAILIREGLKTILTFDATPRLLVKMSQLFLTQALVLDALNRPDESKVSFLNAAAFNPSLQLEPILYSPSVISRFNQAKDDYLKVRDGFLHIESNPSAAEVFIGGKKIGKTPITLKDLSIGVQEIKITKEKSHSWKKAVAIISTGSKKYTHQLEVDLNRGVAGNVVDTLIGEIVSHKTLESQLNKIENLGQFLSTDFVFAVRVEKVERKSLRSYDLFVVAVDSKTGTVVKGYQEIGSNLSDSNRPIAQAIQKVIDRKPPAKFTDLIAVESSNQNNKKPFYKRWYFYTLLGVAVAGGGAGATVLLTRGSSGSNISPYTSGVVGTPGRQP